MTNLFSAIAKPELGQPSDRVNRNVIALLFARWVRLGIAIGVGIGAGYPSQLQAADLFDQTGDVSISALDSKTLARLDRLNSGEKVRAFAVRRFSTEKLTFDSVDQIKKDYPYFDFETPSGQHWRAEIMTVYEQPGGHKSWVGRIEGDTYSVLVVTIENGYMAADAVAFGETISVKPIGRELASIRSLAAIDGKSEDVIEPPKISENARELAGYPSEDDGKVIDFYVYYSNLAGAASASINTEIINDVAYTNAALDRSCTQTYLRLVGMAQITVTEHQDGDKYLSELSDPFDGTYDGIYDTLKTNGVDLVQLWVENSLGSSSNNASVGSVAGIAMAALPYPGFNTGFSVKVRSESAAVSAHEIGHNFTVYHDRFQCPDQRMQANYGIQSGFGYVDLENRTRDIMSYSSECAYHGLTCERVPYYSNPRVMVQGRPFGIGNQADAAYTIYKNRVHVARIRPAASPPTAPTFSLCSNSPPSEMKIDKCFIATAAYGSRLDPHVTAFRQFRDRVLASSEIGRWFIKNYYAFSPPAAAWLDRHDGFKPAVRAMLWGLLIPARLVLEFGLPFAASALTLGILALTPLFSRRVRSRFRSLVSLPLIFAIAGLSLLEPTSASASANTPTLIPNNDINDLRNPAALGTAQTQNSIGGFFGTRSGKYGSTANDSLRWKEASAVAVNGQILTPSYGLQVFIEPGSKTSFEWPKSANITDTWQSTRADYRFAGAYRFFDGLSVGLSYRMTSTALPREATTSDWGVHSTNSVESSYISTLGARYNIGAELAAAIFFDYGEVLATEVSRVITMRGGVGVGYFHNDASLSYRADLTYINQPEAVADEGPPFAIGLVRSTAGLDLELEMKYTINWLIYAVALGLESESYSSNNYSGLGAPTTSSAQTLRAGFWPTSENLVVTYSSKTTTSKSGAMSRSDLASKIGVSIAF